MTLKSSKLSFDNLGIYFYAVVFLDKDEDTP